MNWSPTLHRVTLNDQQRCYWVGDLAVKIQNVPGGWKVAGHKPSMESMMWVHRAGLTRETFARRADAVRAVIAADQVAPAPRYEIPPQAQLIADGKGRAKTRDGHFAARWESNGWRACWEVRSSGRYAYVSSCGTLWSSERQIARHLARHGADA